MQTAFPFSVTAVRLPAKGGPALSRIVSTIFFGLILPAVIVGVLFGLASSADEAMPLISDMLAEGADRAELFSILLEEAGSVAVQGFLFYSVVAAPALAVIGPLAFLVTRRPFIIIVIATIAGLFWGTTVDYYDSFFTGPGVEWDWPLGGALYGLLVAALAVILLKRRGTL